MTEELGAISVGLQVGMGTLKADLAKIKTAIEPIEREHVIPFAVGKVSFAQVQKELQALAQRQIPVQLMAGRGSGATIHKELTAQLRAAGPVPVRIKANLSVTEVNRIRAEITKAISRQPIPIKVRVAEGGAGAAPIATPAPRPAPRPAAGRAAPIPPLVASAPTAAPVAAPRPSAGGYKQNYRDSAAAAAAVHDATDAPAAKPKTSKTNTPPAAPSTVAAKTPAQPAPPKAARASTPAQKPADRRVADPDALRGMVANLQREIDKDPKGTHVPAWKKTQGDLQRMIDGLTPVDPATAAAAAAPKSRPKTAKERATSGPSPTVGAAPATKAAKPKAAPVAPPATPTGPRILDLDDPDVIANFPQPKSSAMRRLRKQGERRNQRDTNGNPVNRVSMDTLRSARVDLPETPEEIEYASRPTKVSLPLDEQAQADLDRRSRGTRGASRAGFRSRGERVQTVAEITQVAKTLKGRNATHARARNAEIKFPAKRPEGPYYGSMEGTDPRLRRQIEIKQMSRIHPVLGEAMALYNEGDLAGARACISGLSLKMKGADPKSRKKWYRQIRNVEKANPALVEQDAGLSGLFSAIRVAVDPDAVNLHGADYIAPGIKETKGGGKKSTADADLAALNRGEMTRAELQSRHPEFATLGISGTPRASSVSVSGPAKQSTPAKTGPIVKGKVQAAAPLPDPEWIPYQSVRGRFDREAVFNEFLRDQHESDRPAMLDRLVGAGRITSAQATSMGKWLEAGALRSVAKPIAKPVTKKIYVPPPIDLPPKKRVSGGPIEGALTRRIREAAEYKKQKIGQKYLVGENRPETYVDDRGGHQIVGANGPEVRAFPRDGKIVPFVPEWLKRQTAKDLTGARATGGRVKGRKVPAALTGTGQEKFWAKQNRDLDTEFADANVAMEARLAETKARDDAEKERVRQAYLSRSTGSAPEEATAAGRGFVLRGISLPTGGRSARTPAPSPEPAAAPVRRTPAKAPEYEGRLAAEPGSGPHGRKVVRDEFPGERASIASGKLSSGGGVQRVFVTNWPSGAGFGGGVTSSPRSGSVAAGPLAGLGTKEAGALLKRLRRETRPVVAKGEKTDTRTPPITPAEAITAKLAARGDEDVQGLVDRRLARRNALTEVQQQIPVRSLAPAMGQISASTKAGGRGEILRRLAVARHLDAQATKAVSEFAAAQEKLNKLETAGEKIEDPEKKKAHTKEIEKQAEATEKLRDEAFRLDDAASGAAKSADNLGLKMRVLAANTVGIIGGTLAFGATLGVAQAGLSALGVVAAPVIERLSGFTATSAAVTSALGEQIKAQNGAAKSAFAMTAAQAGLSNSAADMIGPLLQQRASTEQNNKTLQSGIDLLHGFEDAQKRGGAQGLTGTTGGQFGSIVGGTASTQELIKKELNDPLAKSGAGLDRVPEQYRDLAVKGAQAAKARGESEVPVYLGGAGVSKMNVDEILGTFDVLGNRVAFFNDALAKGGSKLHFLANVSKEAADTFAGAADRAGATELGDTARGPNRVILVDENNAPALDKERILGALGSVNQAASTPDPQLIIKQITERIVPAQKALFRAQSVFQRESLGPGQFALSQIASPTPGTTGGPSFSKGLVGVDNNGKTDKAAQKAANAYEKKVGGAIQFVNAEIEKGRQAMLNLVPADTRTQFSGLLDEIGKVGKSISDIQLGIQQQQVNLQVSEYNNQLRIARRSLTDAYDLQAGIAGATRDTVGGIEGQNIALNRQLQLLQFQQQQRQINFRLATAGFVAPGTTPEERAARIEAAKKEADFAQKQLDTQKKIADLSYKGIKITADRNVTDLIAQISLLEQGKQVTIDTAAAQRALDILNKKQQRLLENAGTYIEEGAKITSAAMTAAEAAAEATGKAFGKILTLTAKAWGVYGTQAQSWIDILTGTASPHGGGSGNGSDGNLVLANGIVGDTLGPTQITVGEAGGEKVAVLKNPKIVPSSALSGVGGGGGGGGGPLIAMTVIISGNSIREDTDLEMLAEKVAQKTEDRIMRKTSLFGLRRA